MPDSGGDFVALDLETTGLFTDTSEIIALAAVRFIDGEPVALFMRYCRINGDLSKQVEEITGITPDMIADAVDLGLALDELKGYISESPVVVYNADFAMKFLSKATEAHGFEMTNAIVDVHLLTKEKIPGLLRYLMRDILKKLGISVSDEKGVLGGAYDVANVYKHLKVT
jgi:DNA polymerase-3 subunit alpha (Gram-positive type)